jgi:hypothetical protein
MPKSMIVVALALACGAASEGGEGGEGGAVPDRCVDTREQILSALQTNIEIGVLIPSAVPCGDDGVENRPDYFDPRVPASSVGMLQDAFAAACAELESRCPDGAPSR